MAEAPGWMHRGRISSRMRAALRAIPSFMLTAAYPL
ncbi:hypothetical protein B14911_06031 [Bacillus sp. NRRL B-14911]|nr:hypothetical protein B14911_06031 [Bacillus sp. NRRL B-14911]